MTGLIDIRETTVHGKDNITYQVTRSLYLCWHSHGYQMTRHCKPHRLFLRYRHLTPDAHNYRPAAVLIWPSINEDWHLHRSTLLLNLHCADNVPNINFNAAPNTNKLKCFDSTRRWRHHSVPKPESKQISGFHFFNNFLIVAHFCDQSRYASGFYDVKGSWSAVYLKKYNSFAYFL